MPRHPNVSMKATNLWLEFIAESGTVGAVAETETALAARLGVSRAVARSVFQYLEKIGILSSNLRRRTILRLPRPEDYYLLEQTESRSDLVERRFMDIARTGKLVPGQNFTEAEIARSFGASTVSVREFLIGFSRYGLVEKASNGSWRFCAFDESFARELASLRRQFEIDGLSTFANLGENDPAFAAVDALLVRHWHMRRHDDDILQSFSSLDREFHQFIVQRLNNRFVASLYDVVSFVFHFHYQWRKDAELARNAQAIDEHLAILDALKAHNPEAAIRAMEVHLATSLRTLLESAIR